MKSYTDIEQSKKLAEILPLESADYFHAVDMGIVITASYITYFGEEKCIPAYKGAVPCWSLAALEDLIWNTSVDAVSCPHIYNDKISNGYYILYGNYETTTCSSIVDACYEMILKLHELKKL